MSFDIYLMAIEDGEVFDRTIAEQAFEPFSIDRASDDWTLYTPEGEAYFAAVFIDNEPKINGFSVSSPPSFRNSGTRYLMCYVRRARFYAGPDPNRIIVLQIQTLFQTCRSPS
jgi:hypothetical protein